jgi:hypothetical protein
MTLANSVASYQEGSTHCTNNTNEIDVKLLVNRLFFIKLVTALKSGMLQDPTTVTESDAATTTFIETLSVRTDNDEETRQLLEDIKELLQRRDEIVLRAGLHHDRLEA